VVPPRAGRGRWPELTDSELICLAVAHVLLGYHRERRWVRHVRTDPQLLGMFPSMLTQSAYHKRLKTAQPLLSKAIWVLAVCCPSWFDDLWITDAGVFTRVAQRLLAMAAGIWHNWTTGATSKRSLIAFDH
jgi:hypothetical protein